ncbi:MAG TPA: hypothetical protein VEC36_11175 [Patescibacteria group bacterium]|nr:hypothetical protein [Patescibacteria group bacterium]
MNHFFKFLTSLVFVPVFLWGQDFPDPIKEEKVCFRYSFSKGDTLRYTLFASDSIVLDGRPDLVKRRTETVQIVCDSVGTNGHFYLTQSLVGYSARETSKDTLAQMRFSTPWLNRRASFEIDSTGKRFSWNIDEPNREAITPGGAFQEILIVPFKESCKRINESWMVQSDDDLPENGSPAPFRRQATFFRALDPLDTLGERANRFQLALTGQGVAVVGTDGNKIRTTSILTTSGIMDISTQKHVPIHYLSVSETKLKIESQRGEKLEGKQFNRMRYILTHYRSADRKESSLKME